MQMRWPYSALRLSEHGRALWRFVLLAAMFIPGFLLTFFPNEWSQGTISPTFHQLANLHIPVQAIGVVLLVSAFVGIWERWRDVTYGVAAAYYGIALMGALIATFSGDLRSVLLCVLPVAIVAYVDAALATARDRELKKIPSIETDSDAE